MVLWSFAARVNFILFLPLGHSVWDAGILAGQPGKISSRNLWPSALLEVSGFQPVLIMLFYLLAHGVKKIVRLLKQDKIDIEINIRI